MRKIIAGLFQSIDGVVQPPGAPQEDPSGVLVGVYEPAGAVPVGTFMLDR